RRELRCTVFENGHIDENDVASKGATVKTFVRFEVGEGIEKREDNFVEEVMSQVKK
ncbi:hypothetical protein G6X37_07285, partial [Staphylococcus aureus]|nr:hypothetical protein [Staphylococcus aureus]